MGYSAEVLHKLVLRHPHTVVLDSNGVFLVIRPDVYLQRKILVVYILSGELKVSEFFECVRGIRNELPYKYLFVRIKGVYNDIQYLLYLSLEFVFFRRILRHFRQSLRIIFEYIKTAISYEKYSSAGIFQGLPPSRAAAASKIRIRYSASLHSLYGARPRRISA